MITAIEINRCPVELTLDVIGGKWKPLIIFYLQPGTLRFGELQRQMPRVTRRMLTQHLRELEADGMIHRQVYAQVPPKVEYSLTDAGRRLGSVLDAMLAFGLWYGEARQNFVAEREIVGA